METETARKPIINVKTSIHFHRGVSEINVVAIEGATAYINLGTATLFFDDEDHLKAFVGEMIKAVASLK